MSERVSIEGLRNARAVAETGSFSAAARVQGYSQPALSSSIAKLEEKVGERLFVRSTQGVRLTGFGERLLPLVDQALIAVDAVVGEADRWTSEGDETVRVGVSPLIESRLVAAAFAAVCGGNDALRRRDLVLREANMADLRAALIEGELDMILIPAVGPLPRYEHRIVASEPLVLVHGGDGCGGGGPARLADLGDNSLILMPDTCGLTAYTCDLLASHDLPVRPYAGEASSYKVLEEWAGLGIGAAVVPRSKLVGGAAHRPLVTDDGMELEIFYEVVWNPNSVMAGDLAALAERIRLEGSATV